MADGSQSVQQVRSPTAAGLKGRCPRCGKGRMFAGFLEIVPTCPECGRANEPTPEAAVSTS